MKRFIVGLIALGTLATQGSYASVEAMSEEQMLDSKASEILSIPTANPQDAQKKKSLLRKIKLAKVGFKGWKENNPNHKEIRNEFKKISKRIQTKGTPEFIALSKALESCKNNSVECQSKLKSNIESIYTNSEIPTYAAKKGFSIISSAYASGVTADLCVDDRDYIDRYHRKFHKNPAPQYFAGLIGEHEFCGLSYFGPGLGIMDQVNQLQVCVGDGQGINVGPYANATALLGLGVGLTVGQGGVCQILSFNVGIGAFAGLVITDDFGPHF